MDVYDIKSEEEWQKILDDICRELGVPATIFDEKNKVLQLSGERNELCRRIREDNEGFTFICGQSQQYMAEQARTTKKPVVDACEAGMAKFVIPLWHNGQWVGSLGACGACLSGEEIEEFMIQKNAKINEKTIEMIKNDVPKLDRPQFQEFVERLFRVFENDS